MAHLNGVHNGHLQSESERNGEPSTKKRKTVQTTLTSSASSFFTGQLPAERTKQLDIAVMKLVIGKVLPMSLTESPYLRDLTELLDPRL
jgi:hypothetical protein